jgi:hypothetical protein
MEKTLKIGSGFLFYTQRYTHEEFWKIVKPSNLAIHENDSKRVAVNLINYTKSLKYLSYNRPTVEFRLPEGTLNGENVKNWVRLFILFVDSAKAASMPNSIKPVTIKSVLSIFGLRHPRRFYILSEGLHKTKKWFLGRVLTHGRSREVLRSVAALSDDLEVRTTK